MVILFKKACRAIWSNKKAYASCVVLISVGILMLTSFGILVERMEEAKEQYYEEYRFADIFAKVNAMPTSQIDRLLHIEGIADVSMRYIQNARVIMPDNEKVITLKLISVDRNDRNRINDFEIVGNNFSYNNDLMIGSAFLEAHNLKIDDSIKLIIQNREVEFNICAAASSPEFVYVLSDTGEILPDPETFSIAYLPKETIYSIVGNYEIANDISFILEKNYHFDDVKTQIEDELSFYGMTQLIERKDQISNSMLTSEIDGQKSMVSSIPVAFMLMSSIILYLMLKRIIEQERQQIGALKAFGYSQYEILLHYLFYGAIVGAAGGIVGVFIGYLSAGSMIEMMLAFYDLPMKTGNYPLKFYFIGISIGVLSGLIGAYAGAKNVLHLDPAEAMRASAPPPVKNNLNIPLIYSLLNSRGHMAVRSLLRNKIRSSFTILGVTFSFGILAFMASYTVMIDDMLVNLVTKVQVYDLKINLVSPTAYEHAIQSVSNLPDVELTEALLEIPVELKNKHRKEPVLLIGIEEDATLFKLYDNDKRINFVPPSDGIILSSSAATKLEAEIGDKLIVASPLLNEDIEVYVSSIVAMNLGGNAYIELDYLTHLFDMPKSATSVIAKTENISEIKNILLEAKNVSGIEDKASISKMYTEQLDTYSAMIIFLELGAAAIAFAIIYNASTISLSERKREYATLRVLGMQVKEVAEIVSFEYWTLSIIGMLLGIPFTHLMKEAMASSIDVELFTMSTYTPMSAFITAAIGCSAAVLLSNLSAIRNIKKFDMVEVLKERE